MKRRIAITALVGTCLAACTTTVTQEGTLAELEQVPADLNEVYLEDSLEKAAQSYRRYLNETEGSARTPEAMRRLADLQIEQAYGVIGSGDMVEMAAPEAAETTGAIVATNRAAPREQGETDTEFEERALSRDTFLAQTNDYEDETAWRGWPASPGRAP